MFVPSLCSNPPHFHSFKLKNSIFYTLKIICFIFEFLNILSFGQFHFFITTHLCHFFIRRSPFCPTNSGITLRVCFVVFCIVAVCLCDHYVCHPCAYLATYILILNLYAYSIFPKQWPMFSDDFNECPQSISAIFVNNFWYRLYQWFQITTQVHNIKYACKCQISIIKRSSITS